MSALDPSDNKTLTLQVVSYQRDTLGPNSTKVFGTEGGTVGRTASNDWALPDHDRIISGKHASFSYEGGNFYVRDTSTNGVFLNGSEQAIGNGNAVPISNGARLMIGDYDVLVTISEGAGSAASPLPSGQSDSFGGGLGDAWHQGATNSSLIPEGDGGTTGEPDSVDPLALLDGIGNSGGSQDSWGGENAGSGWGGESAGSGWGGENTGSGWGGENTGGGWGGENAGGGWGGENTGSGWGGENTGSGWGVENTGSGWGVENTGSGWGVENTGSGWDGGSGAGDLVNGTPSPAGGDWGLNEFGSTDGKGAGSEANHNPGAQDYFAPPKAGFDPAPGDWSGSGSESIPGTGAISGTNAIAGAEAIPPGPAPGSFGAEPGAYGAEPGAYGAEPGAYGAEPGAYGAEPGAYGAEPGAYGAEPGAYGAEPGAYGAEPGAYGAEPGAYGAEPGAYGAEPGAYGAEPGAYGAEPGAYGAQPGMFGAGHGAFGGEADNFGQGAFGAEPGTLGSESNAGNRPHPAVPANGERPVGSLLGRLDPGAGNPRPVNQGRVPEPYAAPTAANPGPQGAQQQWPSPGAGGQQELAAGHPRHGGDYGLIPNPAPPMPNHGVADAAPVVPTPRGAPVKPQPVAPQAAPAQVPEHPQPVVSPAVHAPNGGVVASPGASDSALLQAFLEGAELTDVKVDPAKQVEVMRNFGQICREVIGGLMSVLMARASIKSEFRMAMTTIRPIENNPLKFSVTVEDALHHLLFNKGRGYLEPVEAVQEGFQDIKDHQMAVMAGMRAAFDSMITRFDPEGLEERFDRTLKRASFLTVNKKSKYWELYTELYEDITRDAEDNFQSLFGEEFAKAYEEQIQRMAMARRT